MKKGMLTVFVIATLIGAGCATGGKTQKGSIVGAALGTAVGAGLGYALGGSKGAAIGAGSGLLAGGLSGAAIGKYMDRQEGDFRQALGNAEAVNIQREHEILALTFQSDILFDFDSAIIKPGAYDEIERVAGILQKYPLTRIFIEGHTDSKGLETYNQELSVRRAAAVKKALVVRGIDPYRLETIGLGEAKPLAGNETVAGRQLNRRVRLIILPIG